jgi:beta-barrel assembly-enhancing protease
MKRAVAFVIVLAVGLTGLFFSQRRHDPTPVSANALVAMAADAQRDLTRAPMRLTRLSDDEEIALGQELAAQYSVPTRKN